MSEYECWKIMIETQIDLSPEEERFLRRLYKEGKTPGEVIEMITETEV